MSLSVTEVIGYGEGKTIEFFESIPSGQQVAEVAAAFSNRAGGYIIIGVHDNGNIVGIGRDEADSALDVISRAINTLVVPTILPEIYPNRIDDKTVLVIRIFPGASTPYYIKTIGKIKGTFIRVGKTNIQADGDRIIDLERQKFNITFDEDTACEANPADIAELSRLLSMNYEKKDAEHFDDYIKEGPIDREQLYDFKLIKKYGDIEYFTNAALIILGKMQNSGIRCAKFRGDTDNEIVFKRECLGNIFEQLEAAVSFLQGTEIPLPAIREALANALIHRDYAITGSDIRIGVYETKIEIISPGDLPKTISLDDILSKSGRTEARNKVVARVLRDCRIMDQWGSGINRMISLCSESGLKVPDVTEDGIFLRVTFYRYPDPIGNQPYTEVDDTLKQSETQISISDINQPEVYQSNESTVIKKIKKIKKKDLTAIEKDQIIKILSGNPKATAKIISETLNISIASVKRRINKMQKDGILIRVGFNKGGHWRVLENK